MTESDNCLGPERKAAIEEVLTEQRVWLAGPTHVGIGVAIAQAKVEHWMDYTPTDLTAMDLSRLYSMADVGISKGAVPLTPEREDTMARVSELLRKLVK